MLGLFRVALRGPPEGVPVVEVEVDRMLSQALQAYEAPTTAPGLPVPAALLSVEAVRYRVSLASPSAELQPFCFAIAPLLLCAGRAHCGRGKAQTGRWRLRSLVMEVVGVLEAIRRNRSRSILRCL